MEHTECSETSAYKIQAPGYYTEENIEHTEHGENDNQEKFGGGTRKTFDRFTTKDSYTWNITHNTESTAV